MKEKIETSNAPKAIGYYSQAIKIQNTIFISGQIPLDPKTMLLVSDDIQEQIKRVFENLKAIAEFAGGSLDNLVRITVYLKDISHLALVNEEMKNYFKQPFPARTSFGVSALPKDAKVEVDAIMVL